MSGFSEDKLSDGKAASSMIDLSAALKNISQKCTKCNLCINECEFLRQHGKPGDIADNFDLDKNPDLSIAFKCSLCRLCAAVCPVEIDPSKMFLELRRVAAAQGNGVYVKYKDILDYERRGISKPYTWYGLPENCDTIFFPGCNLPGTRPQRTLALFEHLRQETPSMGIVLDCCTNISHDLGRQDFFLSKFHEMRQFLVQSGVKNIIVACPSCYKIFEQYGEGLSVKSVYELLSDNNPGGAVDVRETITIHDPCALRFNKGVQDSVRKIINGLGLGVSEMSHSGLTTLCCGEGGSVRHLSPDFSKRWAIARSKETGNNRVITYCGGCVNQLGKTMPASHILDLIFDVQAILSGDVKVSKAPLTYLNRMWLKRRLKKSLKTAVNHERL